MSHSIRLTFASALAAVALAGCGARADTATCPTDPARRVIIVLPDAFASPQETATVAAALDAALMQSSAINTEVVLLNGETGRRLDAGCGVADDPRMRAPAIRRAVAVNPIMAGFVAAYAHAESETPLDFVAAAESLAHFAGDPMGPPTAAVIVAPRLRDRPLDAHASFAGGRYPSDGVLAAPETAFSVVGREERLAGLELYFAALDEPWESDRHQRAVDRFVYWWSTRQGGAVRSLTDGLEASLRLALAGEGRLGDTFAPEPDRTAKPEMLDVSPAEIPVRYLATIAEFEDAPTFNRPAVSYVGALELAVLWNDADVDLDLYASTSLDDDELYYANTRVEGVGAFEKRSESGREGARGFEFVTFDAPVDIRETTIAVNLYEVLGGAPTEPIEGELRVLFDGATYRATFRFEAGLAGDLGARRADRAGRGAAPEWLTLDLAAVIPAASN